MDCDTDGYQERVHEESQSSGPTPMRCRRPAASVNATSRNPGFWHNGQVMGLSGTLWGAPAALEDRAGCLDIALSAIVAQDSIMADTHQSRREDMQTEAADELQG